MGCSFIPPSPSDSNPDPDEFPSDDEQGEAGDTSARFSLFDLHLHQHQKDQGQAGGMAGIGGSHNDTPDPQVSHTHPSLSSQPTTINWKLSYQNASASPPAVYQLRPFPEPVKPKERDLTAMDFIHVNIDEKTHLILLVMDRGDRANQEVPIIQLNAQSAIQLMQLLRQQLHRIELLNPLPDPDLPPSSMY